VNPQQNFEWKRRTTRLRHWGQTLNHSNKPRPRDDAINLFQKNSLARFLGGKLETIVGKGSLFQPLIFSSHSLERPGFAGFL
jgi:hypothetical protein